MDVGTQRVQKVAVLGQVRKVTGLACKVLAVEVVGTVLAVEVVGIVLAVGLERRVRGFEVVRKIVLVAEEHKA